MEEVFVLSHAGDIDGIGSAALLRMKYGVALKNIFFSTRDFEDIPKVISAIQRSAGKNPTLFITDLGIDEKSAGQFLKLVRLVKARHGTVFWFDHHNWPEDLASKVATKCDLAVFGANKDVCACELVKKYTCLDGAFVNEFARLVHYRDFYIKPKGKDMLLWRRAEKYTWAIEYFRMGSAESFQNGLRHIADVISSGRRSDGRIDAAAKGFKKINEEGIDKLLGKLHIISGKIAVGFATRVNSTDACARIMEKTKADIVILIHTDKNGGSIRSKKSAIDGLARMLGGGGREHTAGFTLPRGYNLRIESHKKQLMRRIEKEARKLKLIPR